MRQPTRQNRLRRKKRLAIERCEPRLTLSGDGGFIELNAGDYLAPTESDFVVLPADIQISQNPGILYSSAADAVGVATFDLGAASGNGLGPVVDAVKTRLDQGQSMILNFADSDGTPILEILQNGNLSDMKFHELIVKHLPADSPAVSQSVEVLFEPADLVPHEGPSLPDLSPPPVSTGLDLPREMTPEEAVPFAGSQNPESSAETSPLLPITVRQALQLSRPGTVLDQTQNADNASATLAEGGPIEVAQAVIETQRAYEAEIFAKVASQLDQRAALAQTSPPVARPLAGELARSVVFEVVGQERSSENTPSHDESHGPNAARPTEVEGGSRAALALKDETEHDAQSRALAFAQWPLYFSAALGMALVGSRKRRQPGATQQPPRRNRQSIAS